MIFGFRWRCDVLFSCDGLNSFVKTVFGGSRGVCCPMAGCGSCKRGKAWMICGRQIGRVLKAGVHDMWHFISQYWPHVLSQKDPQLC